MINIIVATSLNGVIGKDNQLPWDFPEELKVFKEITIGHPIVMGYNTYKSLNKVLPNRDNYVLVRDKNNSQLRDGFIPTTRHGIIALSESNNVFVIGGAKTYDLFFNITNVVYISYILGVYEGDTWFNCNMNYSEWKSYIYKKTEDFVTVKYEKVNK